MSPHLSYKNKGLIFDSIRVSDISNIFKTPFYLYSENLFIKNFLLFKNLAMDVGMIDPLICFAMKANNNKFLLKSLEKLGAGADVVSQGELIQAIEVGISPSKIVFSGVGKTDEEIDFALSVSRDGIYSFNVESLDELERINYFAGKKKKIARVAFRLKPGVVAKTNKHISTGQKRYKFGLLNDDIQKASRTKKYWTNCKLVGISMHIGSQLTDLSATILAIKKMAECAISINKEFEFLDVGGGLGIAYNLHQKNVEQVASIEEYMKIIWREINKHYNSRLKENRPVPRIVFEPGRIIAASSGIFVTKVIRIKKMDQQYFAIVDGGMNDFMRPALYGAYHEIYTQKGGGKEKQLYNVVGPICESSDCFAHDRELSKLTKDDYLIIDNAGAYGFTMSSRYNMRDLPQEIVIGQSGDIFLQE